MDSTKRKTLKAIGVAAIGVTSTSALATLSGSAKPLENATSSDLNFAVNTGHSALGNDIEIVLTNTSGQAVDVDKLSPSRLETARGYFDFDAVTRDGAITIQDGESIRVGLEALAPTVPVKGSSVTVTTSIRDSIREHLSIETADRASTVVTVASGNWLYA